MQLAPAPPTETLPIARLSSERWEMGIAFVDFGFHLQVGLLEGATVVDYRADNNDNLATLLYIMVRQIMEAQPETISETDVKELFPPTLEELLQIATQYPHRCKEDSLQDCTRILVGTERLMIELAHKQLCTIQARSSTINVNYCSQHG